MLDQLMVDAPQASIHFNLGCQNSENYQTDFFMDWSAESSAPLVGRPAGEAA